MERKILVSLSPEEALVLFEWLSRFNKADDQEFEDQAEQRVLWDIESTLEAQLVEPLGARYEEQLASARAKVRDAS